MIDLNGARTSPQLGRLGCLLVRKPKLKAQTSRVSSWPSWD